MPRDGRNEDDPWVIHGKNITAVVRVTAHSQVAAFFAGEGLAVQSEEGDLADMVRVRIGGEAEAVDDCVERFREQNPDVSLHIVESAGYSEDAGQTEGTGQDEGTDRRRSD